jgi:formylglycine-generating enzyme required for sulfatase activity
VSKFEVTFEQWDTCDAYGSCPSVNDSGLGRGRQPVINLTWDQATSYVKWLSRITGKRYRLLTEAEWEYAARAGTTTAYYFGTDEAALGQYAWYRANSGMRPHPVGEKKPNAFGLYDMLGNVWEWVQDCHHSDYNSAPTDGSAWTDGDCTFRIARGGSWDNSHPEDIRSANRDWENADIHTLGLGFRVGRTLNP